MNAGFVAALLCLVGSISFGQFQPIDLSRFIDKPLSTYRPNESWAAPPRGLQTLEGVQFEIVGKIEVTGLGSARDGRFYPSRVAGIPVERKAARVHVLHAAGYADQDGTPIVQVVMNYVDGQRYAVPLSYGVHTRNWYVERNEKTAVVSDTNTMVAWRGSCPDTDRFGVTLRLFRSVIPNPSPDKEIKTIDLMSLFSRATPVIVAMSTESGAGSSFAPAKFDDAPYRRELPVQFDPPTAAVINVTATDANRTYKFGSYTNDAKGPIIIDYAPQMRRLQLAVNSSDFLPAVTNLEKEFPKELVVKLNRGNSIGGFVRTRSGQPIKDAEVIVSQVTDDGAGEFVETDLAWVKTDAEGRWRIFSIIGTNFSKMNFAARHPEFIGADFQQFNDASGNLSTEALLAGKAVLTLAKGASISGTVVDAATGKPVPEFKMIPGKRFVFRDFPLRWDRDNSFAGWDGKFTFQVNEEDVQGGFGLAIEAPGYLPAASPRYTNAGNYTHHFQLKKGEGIRGVVSAPDGKPLAGVQVYLVDSTERVYMNQPGEFDQPYSRNISSAETDAEGRFALEPRLDPSAIVAGHRLGYAEVPAEEIMRSGKLSLQPWGALKGVLRVGNKVETNHFIALQSMEFRYGQGDRFWPPLHLRLVMRPDESGNFTFPKVPPGERSLQLQYGNREGPVPLSHGFAVNIKPGETTNVTLGGSGQRVTGKVIAKTKVDWTRDMHLLVRKHPNEPSSNSFSAQRAFWTSETGRAFEREAFRYVPVFRSDGSFHIDNVPAGEYQLAIRATDPNEENFLIAKPVGELRTNIVVREQSLDLGSLELKIK